MKENNLIPSKTWLVFDDNEILHKPCEMVNFPLSNNEQEIIKKMIAYIDSCYQDKYQKYGIQPGIALTANQMGLSKKIIYIHMNDELGQEKKYLIANPKIISESLQKVYISSGEGCLSVKNDYDGYVPRKEKIVVEAIDLINNEKIIIEASGLLSICLQHEIDHTNGKLYYERINKNNKYYCEKDWIKY